MNLFATEYGYFTESGDEYVILRPDTPTPWVNVISNGDYGIVISQTGGGYSWRTHASMNRLTRWEQDLVRDRWGKYLYIRDLSTGEFWSPTWHPCPGKLEAYQVRHGWGYSIFEGEHEQVRSELTVFVPIGDPCEVWLLRLRNNGSAVRRLQVFSYLEWLLGTAPDWHREFRRLFIETRYDDTQGVMLATSVMWDIPGKGNTHWNSDWEYVAFHSATAKPVGFDGDKRAFLGKYRDLDAPRAVVEGKSFGTQGRWGDGIGSLQVALEAPPGEWVEVAFVLGAADDQAHALALADKYRLLPTVHDALTQVRQFWKELVSGLVVQTPDDAVNVLANGWLAYQAVSCRLWGRTAYYQTGGAYGYRDQLQDSLVWLLLGQPQRTLEQIRLHAAHQYQDGTVLHWWHPIAEQGLPSYYSDDLLWLPFVTLHYLHETGDFRCLQEEIPFFDGGSASLLEHCLRAFDKALSRRSERGLPLILQADWNDALNAVGIGGKGESVWMAHFLHYLLTRWAELPVLDDRTAARFRSEAQSLREAVNAHCWDGRWYWRASTDSGKRIGSSQNVQGRIFLNAQTWSVIADTAPPERAEQALQSVREHLYKPYGALLLAPAYSIPDAEIGYLTRYAPGARENGGVYSHAACWAVLAERKLHGVQAAYRLWRSFCPPLRGMEPERYAAEPYVMPGNVDGPDSPYEGKGGWTWYTGSAAWYLRALVEGVLGIESTLEGLRVRAQLPEEWHSYRLQRRFRGAVYEITVRRAQPGEQAGCTVDGQRWQAETVPPFEPGTTHRVHIVVGE
ncbi:MAG: glycosyl transferase family 36 [Armatimonadota bacterium]|nr:glycosyl transferase family 36 [bacterium]MDW8320955.1 glycosyl transferase family 36 [Armatimonadota bacterium]